MLVLSYLIDSFLKLFKRKTDTVFKINITVAIYTYKTAHPDWMSHFILTFNDVELIQFHLRYS